MSGAIMPLNFYANGSATWQLPGLTLSESVYPANLKMASHCHEPAYFGVVLRGAYNETIASTTRHCRPLTTAFHPRAEAHAVEFENTETRIFRVALDVEWEKRFPTLKLPDQPAAFQGGLLSALALRLYNEHIHRDRWSSIAIEGLMLEILATLSRELLRDSKGSAPPWLAQARDRVVSRISNTPSLRELSNEVGVHPVHLARAWRKHFRCTIGEFVRQTRIEKACREIATSNAPLREIALSLGFFDQSHFANTFKRFTGMTPAAYRKIFLAG